MIGTFLINCPEVPGTMTEKIDNNEMPNQSGIFSKKDIQKYSTEVKPPQKLSVLLIGKTGEGKSDTANTILGEKLCTPSDSPNSCTTSVQQYKRIVQNCNLTVVDTPGCMDTEVGDKILEEIAKAITLVPNGYDAFLIVVKYPLRWTREAAAVIKQLEKLFGKEFYNYCIVLFSFGDNFKAKQENDKSTKTFEDYIQNQDQHMGNLLQKVGFRAVLFDNNNGQKHDMDNAIRDEMIRNLLGKVAEIKEKEKGLYDNALFRKVRELQKQDSDRDYVITSLVSYMKSMLASWCSIS